MKTKYLFLDIDGTIFHGYVPDSAKQAIRQAKANGHKVYLCTGRPIGLVPEVVNGLVEYDGKICASGCYIELDGKLYLDYYFPEQLAKKIVNLLEKNDIAYSMDTNYTILFNKKASKDVQAFETNVVEYDEKLITKKGPYRAMLFDPSYHMPEVSKFGVYTQSKEEMDHIRKALGDLVYMTEDMTIYDITYCEISPKKISKESALNYLVNNHKVPYEDTIAFGDSMNDYQAIKYAGIGVVMGNGDERLKSVADYVTDTLDNDGLAKAFKHLELI